MALFTVRLKDVLKHTDDIGLDSYPIFDPSYRDGLNSKIIDHYWNEEIGHETVSMFRHAMRRKMNEIMPYYNKMYESERHEYDPLSTVDMHTVTGEVGTSIDNSTSSGSTTDNSVTDTTENVGTTNNTTSDTTSRTVSSETPQTMLSGDADYASSASDSTSHSTGDGSSDTDTTGKATVDAEGTSEDSRYSTGETTRDEDVKRTGRDGILGSEAIMKYRQALINVDLMVIDELKDLFMLIWGNGDEYHSHAYPFPGWSA